MKKSFIIIFVLLILISCKSNEKIIAEVKCKYSGCFGGGESKLILYETSDSIIYASLLNNGDKKRTIAKLNTKHIVEFEIFLRELKELKIGMCTTVAEYEIIYNNETIKKIDGTCDWNGFDKLVKNFFENGFYPIDK